MPSTDQTFTVGQVLTAAEMSQLPLGVLGITRTTANVGPTSGTTELDVITAPAVTVGPTNRRLRISFHSKAVTGTVSGDAFTLRIKEGATILAEYNILIPTSTLQLACDFETFVDSPTAGSHTYKVTIQQNAGTGTATVQAGSGAGTAIAVMDVGQV